MGVYEFSFWPSNRPFFEVELSYDMMYSIWREL